MSDTGQWSPPQEPQKPPIPYQNDACFKIYKIEPPAPFDVRYWKFAPGYVKDFITRERTTTKSDLEHLTMVEFCVSQKALPCKALDETADLRILDSLAVYEGRGAQVFTCTTSNEPGQVFVAKVYDPLYYSFVQEDFPATPVNIVAAADADFIGEAATYTSLNTHLGGSLIPQYYGAWAIEQPLLGHMRTVHLILMECISGTPLSEFDPESYTRNERLNVLAKVMEAEVMMNHFGVNHFDLAPRNMIVSPGHKGLGDLGLQVRVIDFNRVEIYILRGFKPRYHTQTRPQSPVTYWDDDYPSQMVEWIDDELFHDRDAWAAWIRHRWSEDSRFLPPT